MVLAGCPSEQKRPAAPSSPTAAHVVDGGAAAPEARPRPAELPLRVAMSGNYLPLHGVRDGQFVGFEADLARALGEALGREVVFLDRAALGTSTLEAVASGKADVALNAITPTPEREKLVSFTSPYLELLVVPAARQGEPDAEVDLAGTRVALVDGPWTRDVRRRIGEQAELVVVKSPKAALALLDEKKVDFVAGEDVGLLEASGDGGLVLLRPILGTSPIALAAPKGKAQPYEDALERLANVRAELEKKWGLARAENPASPRVLLGVCENGAVRLVGAYEPSSGLVALGVEDLQGDRLPTEEEQAEADDARWYVVHAERVRPLGGSRCPDKAMAISRRATFEPPPGWDGPPQPWAKVASDPPRYFSARWMEWIEQCSHTDTEGTYECGEKGYELTVHGPQGTRTATIVVEKLGD